MNIKNLKKIGQSCEIIMEYFSMQCNITKIMDINNKKIQLKRMSLQLFLYMDNCINFILR